MTTEKRYEVLESLPTYGPMYVPITGSNEPFYSEGYVVRFFKADGSNWVANFQQGWTSLNAIYELDNPNKLLVFAGGACYVMNPELPEPIDVFGEFYTNALDIGDGRLVLEGVTDLTIVEANGTYWNTERISWDGFKYLKLEGNIVSGFAYDPTNSNNEWNGFTYDINTRKLTGGSYHWG